MKILNSIIKIPIYLFSKIVKRNKSSLKYLLNVALKNEVADFYENNFLREYAHIDKAIRIIKESNTVNNSIIDVGGADGTTPKIFAKNFPNAKIYIFEPIKEHYSQIENLARDCSNFILIKKAAGNHNGKLIINKASRITSSSIYEFNPEEAGNFFEDSLKNSGKEEIEITTINDVVPQNLPVSILKIDVQGYELEVLKGADKILDQVNLVVLEVNNHEAYKGSPKYFEIDDYLRNKNFHLFDLFPSLHAGGQLLEWDALYINNRFNK